MLPQKGVVNTMKVLFLIPQVDPYPSAGYPHPGIAYLTAVLKQQGIEVQILDMHTGYVMKDIQQRIVEFSPDVIGVTMYSYKHRYVYEIVDKIRLFFSGPIVVGGPHVSAVRKKVLEDCQADFAIKHEGEITLLALLNSMSHKNDYRDIDGLIWRKNGNIIENKDRTYIVDLDTLPIPAYEDFELKKYVCYDDKRLPLVTSRGCPQRCNYCSVRLSMGHKFRARSPENVLKEIEYWYDRGWKHFSIFDDTFSFDIDRAKKICDLIIERDLEITYCLYNGIRVDRVDRELLHKMKMSGCTFIAYGVETGDSEVMKAIRKGINLEQVRNVIDMTNEVGIDNAANFIIGHPTETFERFQETMEFAESLPTSFLNIYNLIPYPGTDLYRWIEKNGHFLYTVDEYLNEIDYGEEIPVFETEEFTKVERIKALKIGRALYRRSILQYKLGKKLGYVAYLLTNSKLMEKAGINFFKGTHVGNRILKLMTKLARKDSI
jgi:radical SAM superfamily enzyme YgiQ (UPF0313 family)